MMNDGFAHGDQQCGMKADIYWQDLVRYYLFGTTPRQKRPENLLYQPVVASKKRILPLYSPR